MFIFAEIAVIVMMFVTIALMLVNQSIQQSRSMKILYDISAFVTGVLWIIIVDNATSSFIISTAFLVAIWFIWVCIKKLVEAWNAK